MKIGIITTPNEKGQIVIPKKYREVLAINETVPLNLSLQGSGIYIQPVGGIVTKKSKEQILQVLRRTLGSWSSERGWKSRERKQRKLELEASNKAREAW